MATKYWQGRAASVAQITKVAYSAVTIGVTYRVAINGKVIEYAATTTTLSDLVDALVELWNASAEPEHQEMTAAPHYSSGVTYDGLKLTANTAGVPITVTASTDGAPTATVSDDTAASGPNFWNDADNWNGAALPAAGDTLIIADTAVSILYGLTDTTNYARIDIDASFTGSIGLPATNANSYPEYRTRYLTLGDGLGSITVNIGSGTGAHPSRCYIDFANATVTLTVLDGAANQLDYPMEFLNLGSSSTAQVFGGGVLFDDSTTGTISSIKVVNRSGTRSQPRIETTSAVTTTTVEVYGGTATLYGSGTTLKARDGAIVTVAGAAAFPNVTVSGRAEILWESSGGIATMLTVQAEGKIDFGRTSSTKTVAACDIYATATVLDSLDIITWTAGIDLVGCRLKDVTLDLGVDIRIS